MIDTIKASLYTLLSFKKLLFGADCRRIKARRLNYYVFLLFLILINVSCSHEQAIHPFKIITPGKSTLHFSQFELIDDFNNGVSKNRHGGTWGTEATGGAKTSLGGVKKNSVNSFFGNALEIRFDIPAGGSATISSSLKSLDMSQAKLVVGRVNREGWVRFGGEAWIALLDFSGKCAKARINPKNTSEEWLDIELPAQMFRGVDFDRLKTFELVLKSLHRPARGTLIFDELAFFGPADLYFKSASDNLKGFPTQEISPNRDKLDQASDSREFLRLIAKDTWQYFDQTVDQKTNLIFDHVRLGKIKGVGDYTSPTTVSFYWLACIAARDLGFITHEEAARRIARSLATVERLERWQKGFYYNFYHTGTLAVTRRYVSSVDNGWLVAALAVARQAFPGKFDNQIEGIIKGINFSKFYDSSNGQLKLGFDEELGSFSPYHYGLLVSEARLMSYVAIAKGDLPKVHWARIYRTLPKAWSWQRQVPKGIERTLFGVPIFESYYFYGDEKIVPSWGGSLFEFLAPILLIDEQRLAPTSFARNNKVAVEVHIDYARKKGYSVWGIAPAAIPNGKQWLYREFGVKEIAAKGYPEEGVIAPYASILALEIEPEEVIRNLRKLLALYPGVYGPYGFYDSVDVSRGRVSKQYLALDQGMVLVAIANYLGNGTIRKRFHQDPIGKGGEELLTKEHFFE